MIFMGRRQLECRLQHIWPIYRGKRKSTHRELAPLRRGLLLWPRAPSLQLLLLDERPSRGLPPRWSVIGKIADLPRAAADDEISRTDRLH
jgi:hypothetical protein